MAASARPGSRRNSAFRPREFSLRLAAAFAAAASSGGHDGCAHSEYGPGMASRVGRSPSPSAPESHTAPNASMLFDLFRMNGLEGSQAHLQRDRGDFDASPSQLLEDRRRKMQSGRGRGHSPRLPGEDRLVALAVFRLVAPRDVRRQRNVAEPFDRLMQVTLGGDSQNGAARSRRVQPLRRKSSPSPNSTRSPSCIFLPGRTSASHSSGRPPAAPA